MPFWKNLKEGSDHFEVTKQEPKVDYCGQRYVFNASAAGRAPEPNGGVPAAHGGSGDRAAVASKQRADEEKVAELVQKGTPAVRIQYADGGQHSSFRQTAMAYSGGNDGAPVSSRASVNGTSARSAGPRRSRWSRNTTSRDRPAQDAAVRPGDRGRDAGSGRRCGRSGSGPGRHGRGPRAGRACGLACAGRACSRRRDGASAVLGGRALRHRLALRRSQPARSVRLCPDGSAEPARP